MSLIEHYLLIIFPRGALETVWAVGQILCDQSRMSQFWGLQKADLAFMKPSCCGLCYLGSLSWNADILTLSWRIRWYTWEFIFPFLVCESFSNTRSGVYQSLCEEAADSSLLPCCRHSCVCFCVCLYVLHSRYGHQPASNLSPSVDSWPDGGVSAVLLGSIQLGAHFLVEKPQTVSISRFD